MPQAQVKKIKSLWERCDDFVDCPKVFTKEDAIQRKYVLKEYLSKVGQTEDDFVIDYKPVLVEEFDLQEQITEQAKGTDLKSLIAQVIRTGDATILEQRQASYGDISDMPTDALDAHNAILIGQQALDSLDDKLKAGKDIDAIAGMSKEDIETYVQSLVDERLKTTQSTEVNKESEVN